MDNRPLTVLAKSTGCNIVSGSFTCDIQGIAWDSRDVRPGFCFFALPGVHVDGHDFITAAWDAGAVAVVSHRRPDQLPGQDRTFIVSDDVRYAMSAVSARYYETDKKSPSVIGVTGTDGKSSCTSYLYQLLNLLGAKTGFLSTVAMDNGSGVQKNPWRQSTPESPTVHRVLAEALDNGCSHLVLESTSHGLSPKTARLAHVSYDHSLFTNLSHEHLEFHGSFEQYRDDKANLFRKTSGYSVVNGADPSASYMANAAGGQSLVYNMAGEALWAEHVEYGSNGISWTMASADGSIPFSIPFFGSFNVDNLVGVCALLHHGYGYSLESLSKACSRLVSVPGRMEMIQGNQNFRVIVDYAHTPGSFERVFPHFREITPGKLMAVFGSAGERDREKRPIQGRIAAQYSDELFLCDEDPRLEDSMTIIDEIASGIPENSSCIVHKMSDRRHAIRTALSNARDDDTVVLLGKGHESSIIYDDGSHPWDEAAVARELLASIYPRKER